MDQTIKQDKNLVCCLVFAALAIVFNLFAFFSPYWIVGKEGIQKEFVKLGLWEACFNGYVHPEDYVSKKYYGCWFFYWPEYDYIRDWLNPPWFYAVQMLSIVSLAGNLFAFVLIVSCLPDLMSDGQRNNVYAITVQFVTVCASIIVIVSMGVMSKDRNWMPRPDHNYLSWSFAFAVVGAFFSLFSLFNLIIDYVVYNLAPEFKKKMLLLSDDMQLQDGANSTIRRSNLRGSSKTYGTHHAGSTIYSQSGKSNAGLTSGASASAKVREAMLQKKMENHGSIGSTHSLGSIDRANETSINNVQSRSSLNRNGNISSGDLVV